MTSTSSGQSPATPAALTPEEPAALIEAADKCRWDTLHFGKRTFTIDDMPSWLDSIRAQLYTRKSSFLLKSRVSGDDHLQEMCLFALKAALPASKRPTFSTFTSSYDAFKALEKNSEAARRAAALSKQSELTNMSIRSSETIISYLDRAACLWGPLSGSPQAIDESCAVEHALRGLSHAHAWFLALATGSSIQTFSDASELAIRHSSSRVADTPETQHSQHYRGRARGGYGRRRARGSYRGNRPHCSTCGKHHFKHEQCHKPVTPRTNMRTNRPRASQYPPGSSRQTQGDRFHHTVQNVEFCNTEVAGAEGIPLSLCVDSGTTHVITPDAALLSSHIPSNSDADNINLASTDVTTPVEGCGVLTLRSRATGSILQFKDSLHVPCARRTLLCIGKALRFGVLCVRQVEEHTIVQQSWSCKRAVYLECLAVSSYISDWRAILRVQQKNK
jgi:hypothetical protein